MLRVEEQLHPEAAADIGGDDAEFVGLDTEQGSDQVLHQPAALGIGVERPALRGRVVVRHRGAGLHRRDDDPVVDDRQPGDVRRLGELRLRRRRVTDLPVEDQVVLHLRPDQRGAGLHGGDRVDRGGKNVVVHHDRLGGVAGRLDRVGHDECDRVAHMANRPVGENRMRGARHGGPVAVGHGRGAWQRAEALRLQIVRRVDRANPGERRGGGGVDAGDPGSRMRAPQHHTVQHARQHDVVRVAAIAFQQTGIFHTTHRLGEAELGGHRSMSPRRVSDSGNMHAPPLEGQEA